MSSPPVGARTGSTPLPPPTEPYGRRMRPRRLATRLSLGFGVLLGLIALIMALELEQIRKIQASTERLITHDMQRLLRTQSLSLTLEGTGTALLHLMNAPRAQRVPVYADVDASNRRLDGIVADLQGQLDDPEQEATLKALALARQTYFDAFLTTVDQVEANNTEAAMHAYTTAVQPALTQLLSLSNQLINRERERLQARARQTQFQLDRVQRNGLLLSLLLGALGLTMAWRTTRSVVRPLAELERGAQRIAQGDYTAPMPHSTVQEVNRVGQALAQMTHDIAQREQHIQHLAFFDALTELPNRTQLLRQTLSKACATLMLLDLARLKAINATLGYAVGDQLIAETARRLRQVAQNHPTQPFLAHVGGGSFAMLLQGVSREQAKAALSRVQEVMAEPAQCHDQPVDLSLTAGLADCQDATGHAASTPERIPPMAPVLMDLLRNAEVALNAAKGRAQPSVWYGPEYDAAQSSHLNLLSGLRTAVRENQLQMWLQPKLSLRDGSPVGAEALVRWQHPQRGYVSPAEFVPFAEQTGAVTLVTQWMLEQATAMLAQWAHSHPHWSLSVNVSTRDLQDPGFAERVQALLARHAFEPAQLRLEIVESGLMQDAQASIALLHRLRGLGLRLSIDDFGTGYSSLAYLQQLPVSELKIDRSFVDRLDQQPRNQRLVKTMIAMGHDMDLLVTAEGVERTEERDVLAAMGCDVMQGYLGSRPLHGPALTAWIAAQGIALPAQH
ncbi:MAG: hypothetical protein Fur007_01720 [Rhodoferax sp.]